MKERNRHILKKAILKMPVYRAHDEAWQHLKSELETPGVAGYRKSLEGLPKYHAPKGIWEQIETKLEGHHSGQRRRMRWYAAAAVILLCIGTSLNYYLRVQSGKFQEQILPETGLNNSLIYNPELCRGNPEVCNSPVFKELDKQLEEVKKELDLMQPLVENNDPQLLKYYYRLENLRVDIEKRMVKLIIES